MDFALCTWPLRYPAHHTGTCPSLVLQLTPDVHSHDPACQGPKGSLWKGKEAPSFPVCFLRFLFWQHNPSTACSFRQWQFLPIGAYYSKMHIQIQLLTLSCFLRHPDQLAAVTSLEVQDPAPSSPSSEFRDASISSAVSSPGMPEFQLLESPPVQFLVMSDSLPPHGLDSPSGSSVHGISQAKFCPFSLIAQKCSPCIYFLHLL